MATASMLTKVVSALTSHPRSRTMGVMKLLIAAATAALEPIFMQIQANMIHQA